jgi:TonB family protein
MTLGAHVDLVTLGATRLVLKITTDPSGNVTSVQVHQPSGSASVDHIFETTAYEWWFEPPADAGGTAKSDTFLFRITIN